MHAGQGTELHAPDGLAQPRRASTRARKPRSAARRACLASGACDVRACGVRAACVRRACGVRAACVRRACGVHAYGEELFRIGSLLRRSGEPPGNGRGSGLRAQG